MQWCARPDFRDHTRGNSKRHFDHVVIADASVGGSSNHNYSFSNCLGRCAGGIAAAAVLRCIDAVPRGVLNTRIETAGERDAGGTINLIQEEEPMLRIALSLAALVCLMCAAPRRPTAETGGGHRARCAKGRVAYDRQHQHRIGRGIRSPARHRRQDRRTHRRVPPEERPVQEGRGTDERPRTRRKEFPQAESAAHAWPCEIDRPIDVSVSGRVARPDSQRWKRCL